jgi:hypothetical protein
MQIMSQARLSWSMGAALELSGAVVKFTIAHTLCMELLYETLRITDPLSERMG